jgi:hypothetical protein
LTAGFKLPDMVRVKIGLGTLGEMLHSLPVSLLVPQFSPEFLSITLTGKSLAGSAVCSNYKAHTGSGKGTCRCLASQRHQGIKG